MKKTRVSIWKCPVPRKFVHTDEHMLIFLVSHSYFCYVKRYSTRMHIVNPQGFGYFSPRFQPIKKVYMKSGSLLQAVLEQRGPTSFVYAAEQVSNDSILQDLEFSESGRHAFLLTPSSVSQ